MKNWCPKKSMFFQYMMTRMWPATMFSILSNISLLSNISTNNILSKLKPSLDFINSWYCLLRGAIDWLNSVGGTHWKMYIGSFASELHFIYYQTTRMPYSSSSSSSVLSVTKNPGHFSSYCISQTWWNGFLQSFKQYFSPPNFDIS